MEENHLVIDDPKFQSLLAGCKIYTIRQGHRTFSKSITISNIRGSNHAAGITNSYIHTTLSEVPIRIMEAEGFKSFRECLEALRVYYPEITWDSEVTIVEFRMAL